MTWLKIVMILLTAILLTSCITATKVTSVQGKAYVMDGHMFGTGMLNCDANDGEPECWPVNEVQR